MELTAEHLRFAYVPGKTILHDVSLTLKAGETLYVLGRNGGGKTTLLLCLAGLLKPEKGQVTLDGKPILSYSAAERAQRIGLLPQFHTSTFAYTVQEMVMMGRAPYINWLGSPSAKDYQIVEEAMEQVGITDLKDQPITEISGGELQLTSIARGLAQKCQCLLMDEPTAHLDLSNQHRVLEIIQQLSLQGLSFVISSHAPNNALTYADQVLMLSEGWITNFGNPREVLTESVLSSVYGIQMEVIVEESDNIVVPKAIVPRRPLKVTPESLYSENTFLHNVFIKRVEEPKLILITGLSGAGKTTWCTKLVEVAKENGFSVAGILSPGIFEGNNKTGIEILDIYTGERRVLATLRKKNVSKLSTPRWSFNSTTVDWANQVLEDAPISDLVIIDELGPLEFLRTEGLIAGLALIDSQKYQVACVVVRSSLLPKALQRWPYAKVIRGEL